MKLYIEEEGHNFFLNIVDGKKKIRLLLRGIDGKKETADIIYKAVKKTFVENAVNPSLTMGKQSDDVIVHVRFIEGSLKVRS